jgi:hypothetical protein
MVIAYDNVVVPELVTSITTTNITTLTGYPADNLKYADPKREMRVTDTPSADRIIRFDLASIQTVGCIGFLYHNLQSAGYETIRVESSLDGTNWTNVGSGDIGIQMTTHDQAFVVRFDPITTASRFRVNIKKPSGGSRPAFFLGMVFLGKTLEVSKNPTDAQINRIDDFLIETEVTAGGDRYIAPGSYLPASEAEYSWSRLLQGEWQIIRYQIGERNKRKIIAVVPPEMTGWSTPLGNDHFFGYVQNAVSSATSGYAAAQHRYDCTLRLIGAL